jgi:hypothetical protein
VKVTCARAFAIAKTEVTWDQWEACASGGATASASGSRCGPTKTDARTRREPIGDAARGRWSP